MVRIIRRRSATTSTGEFCTEVEALFVPDSLDFEEGPETVEVVSSLVVELHGLLRGKQFNAAPKGF